MLLSPNLRIRPHAISSQHRPHAVTVSETFPVPGRHSNSRPRASSIKIPKFKHAIDLFMITKTRIAQIKDSHIRVACN